MSLNLIKLTILSLLVAVNLHAQEINPGARITAMGNCGTALQDVWSLQANQAGIAVLEKPVVSVSYQNNYLHTDISTQSAVFACPIKNNVFGLSFQNYGVDAYSEQKVGLAYARRFGKGLFLAINANTHQLKINQYGSAFSYSVEAGIQFKVNSRLLIGSHVANPNRSSYSTDAAAAIPTVLQVGTAYTLSDRVIFHAAVLKDLDWLTDARFGLEYAFLEWVAIRGGVNVNPFRQFAGIGCKYQHFKFDVAAASHPALGYSPQMSLGYEF